MLIRIQPGIAVTCLPGSTGGFGRQISCTRVFQQPHAQSSILSALGTAAKMMAKAGAALILKLRRLQYNHQFHFIHPSTVAAARATFGSARPL